MELLQNDYYEAIRGSPRKLNDGQSGTHMSCSYLNNIIPNFIRQQLQVKLSL